MDYSKMLELVNNFLIKSGDRAYSEINSLHISTEGKVGGDVTTNLDKEIEKSFHELVTTNFPDHGFKGEEFPELNKPGEYVWNIDPIDGTKFFAKNVPLWTTTAALVKDGKAVLGAIYNPVSKQLYSAVEGKGAFLNGVKMSINSETDLSKLQICVDLSSLQNGAFDYSEQSIAIVGKLIRNVYRVRMIGSGTLGLAWLSQGMFGGFVDMLRPAEKLVDTAAGFLIAQEAGAKMHTIDLGHGCTSSILARPEVVEKILGIINK